MIELSPEQQQALVHSPNSPVYVVNSRNDQVYVILRAELYERLLNQIDYSGELTEEETRWALREMGKRAGWDDPAMDVYDDLDPRRGNSDERVP